MMNKGEKILERKADQDSIPAQNHIHVKKYTCKCFKYFALK